LLVNFSQYDIMPHHMEVVSWPWRHFNLSMRTDILVMMRTSPRITSSQPLLLLRLTTLRHGIAARVRPCVCVWVS